MKALIKKLVETYGPSGREGQIRDLVHAEVGARSDNVWVDALGNLLVRVNPGATTGRKVLVAAHLDEIGVIASHIDEKGFVRFQTLGGVNPLTCVGGRVLFANGTVGVIYPEVRRDDLTRVPTVAELYIDVGATSRDTCPVRVGDMAGFYRPMEEQGQRLIAKSLDDRVGVAILLETLRQLTTTPHDVIFAFTVQEEVGIRGAVTAAYGVDAEVGLAVDVTSTGDTPNGRHMAVALGQGPAIKVRDARLLADLPLKDLLIQRATDLKMPYQLEVLEGGTTDAAAMQLTRAGMRAGCISIPCRYIHSPSEMCDYGDVTATVQLLLDVLQKPMEF